MYIFWYPAPKIQDGCQLSDFDCVYRIPDTEYEAHTMQLQWEFFFCSDLPLTQVLKRRPSVLTYLFRWRCMKKDMFLLGFEPATHCFPNLYTICKPPPSACLGNTFFTIYKLRLWHIPTFFFSRFFTIF